jgi:WD40 repeat protein
MACAKGAKVRDDGVGRETDAGVGGIATPGDFGRELTAVREKAGLTVRGVARAAGLPASTAGDYFSGRHLPLPTAPNALEAILRACGETDPDRLQEWVRALARARRQPGRPAQQATAPYRGLARFEPEDAPWFFGREELADHLAGLAAQAGVEQAGVEQAGLGQAEVGQAEVGQAGLPLMVVGPSGSGKSSLLRAGFIPRLTAARPGRPVLLFTPAGRPLGGLAVALARLGAGPQAGAQAGPEADPGLVAEVEERLRTDPAGAPSLAGLGPDCGLVIVADQFEGVFTECRDEQERRSFIAAICTLAGRHVIAAALRADFYPHALRYAELAAALQQRQVVLGPMTQEQVRRAIVEPARLARIDVEDVLVELLLRDLAPDTAPDGVADGVPDGVADGVPDGVADGVPDGVAGTAHGSAHEAAHEAGALPLLSHALLVTWQHRHGGRLTVADYLSSGGIRQAIARTAEDLYASLDDSEQVIARRIFLRLVQVSQDAPVARAPVALSDLDRRTGDVPVGSLLGRFVDERLISVGPQTAQITHDALLTAWPRLRGWIDEDHEGLRIRRWVSQAARTWVESGEDSAALLRGGQLAIAREWAATPDNLDSLDDAAHRFLDSSLASERALRQVERRRTRRLRRLVAGLAVLVLVAGLLAGYAFQQRQQATAARDTANIARLAADSRGTAVEASQLRGLDVSVAAQLSLAAYRIMPTTQARASLLEASGAPAAARLIDTRNVVQAVALSPDHRVLAVAAADGTVRLWNVTRPGHPALVAALPTVDDGGGEPLYAVAFSPDGRTLAVAGQRWKVFLWNVADPGRPRPLGPPLTGPRNTVYSLAFRPGGRTLAAACADGTVRLWDLADPNRPRPLPMLTGFRKYARTVAFSPDGDLIAAGGNDDNVRLWNVANPAHPMRLGVLTGPGGVVNSVAFNPAGTMLAAGSSDDKVWLWNVARPDHPFQAGAPLAGATDWVNAVAFSPAGTSIAAGGSDDTVRIWNLATRQETATLGLARPVTTLAWDGAADLISGDADGTARVWRLPPTMLLAGSGVNSVAYSPGGLVAVGTNRLELWDPATGTEVADADVPSPGVNDVAFSPGGLLAAGYLDGSVQLWRATASGLTALGHPVTASGEGTTGSHDVESVVFAQHGAVLATGADDGTVRLWSVRDPARPRLLAEEPDAHTIVYTVAISPDGRTLAAASADDDTRLWNIADPAHPRRIDRVLTGLTNYAIAAAFSPDGDTLAVGGADGTIHLWDVRDPAGPRPIGAALTGPGGYVWALAFSPDGRTLAAGVTDGSAWMWDVSNPARPVLTATLTGPAEQVFSVAFSPDGRTMAVGSADATVRLWDTSPAAAAAAVCATAGQPLTRQEWAAYVPGVPYRPPCPAG